MSDPAPPASIAAAGIAADRTAVDWIAVDWGTSTLRAWAIGADGATLASATSAAGMAGLEPGGFEPALLALVGDWLAPGRATDVIACGMVGARRGWTEAPYLEVPCPPQPDGASLTRAPAADPRLAVRLLPGLSQQRPADVMRGEETQIAGLLARQPGFDGIACLPGTHTKWAHVAAGEVVSFASFMTGEIFALLARSSILRHSVAPDDADWSEPDFVDAVEETLARPERLAGRLFGIRADTLLHGLVPARARARLSGLLVGAELAAARPYWLGRDIVLVGSAATVEPYRAALAAVGVAARAEEATPLTLAGLAAARARLAAGAAA